jgi:hypothetical protein
VGSAYGAEKQRHGKTLCPVAGDWFKLKAWHPFVLPEIKFKIADNIQNFLSSTRSPTTT